MIKLKDIFVSNKFSVDFLYIYFSIEDTTEDLADYSINILKSNHPTDGYKIIAENVSSFYYLDKDINLHNIAVEYFYKVQFKNNKTLESSISEIYGKYKSVEPDNIALGLVYTYKKYVENAINNPELYLLSKKRSGQLCTCYDDIRGRANPRGCEKCYGAMYSGGYYNPIKIKVCFLNAPSKMEEFSPSVDAETETPIQFWTSNFPPIHIGDILIDNDNTRYIVTNATPSLKNYFVIRQTVQMQKLPKSNIVYKIKINM